LGPVVPALQVHSFEIEPVTAENLPVAHCVHSADPATDLYLPISQDVHVPAPSTPVDPALQVHTFESEPLTTEDFPVAHGVHKAGPGAVLYVP
jgi:hypothetical protein